ncbi:MAG: TlpA family protein disulfide reductase [Cypionkella sp.]
MRIVRVFLYTGFMACANIAALGAQAGTPDAALLTGPMAKLILETPKALPAADFLDMAGKVATLEPYKGKWLVLNLWATWCVPCREEMPALDKLAVELPDLAVVALATGPNPPPAITRFLEGAGVKTVTILRDPDQTLAHQIAVVGLPVTLIVNPQGEEVARLIGGADWASPEAKAVFAALME